ncbi:hypothetical protein G7Y89_g12808 [Cudoniella acicularis]|uniref:Major facilitator superfamily (MFS) profile domain-containing protein n=1 Tax=Cudoniella acicularis TaxID=354080 RepID=A0A8H4R9D9_9HELO|nr:hypothetical protein G7Y89_g12808 [Cudoniella acicularis]
MHSKPSTNTAGHKTYPTNSYSEASYNCNKHCKQRSIFQRALILKEMARCNLQSKAAPPDSNWYAAYHAYKGDIHKDVFWAHKKYGATVRYGPNRLIFATAEAMHDIYHSKNVRKSVAYTALSSGPDSLNVHNVINKAANQKMRKRIAQWLSDDNLKQFEPTLLLLSNTFVKTIAENEKSMDGWAKPVNISEYCHNFDLQTNPTNRYMIHWAGPLHRFNSVYVQSVDLAKYHLEKILYPRGILYVWKLWKASRRFSREQFSHASKSDDSLLSILYKETDPDTKMQLSAIQIWSELKFVMVTGAGSPASALAAILFYIMRHPSCYSRLVEEIRSTFMDASDIHSGKRMASCRYLHACIIEGLRMAPSFGGILWREVEEGGVTIDGEFIGPGYDVGTGVYAIHHNETYFPDAFAFKPERWLQDETGSSIGSASQGLTTFSMGPRQCLGRNLVSMELSDTIALLLWHLDLRVPKDAHHNIGGGVEGTVDENEFQFEDHIDPCSSASLALSLVYVEISESGCGPGAIGRSTVVQRISQTVVPGFELLDILGYEILPFQIAKSPNRHSLSISREIQGFSYIPNKMPGLQEDKVKTQTSELQVPEFCVNPLEQEAESLQVAFLYGWRFYGTITGSFALRFTIFEHRTNAGDSLYIGLFLATMEVSIVGTALVAIIDDLGDFGKSFLVIWAQFSDVLGRKLFVALAVITFMIFSGACAGAQSATQLIIFRAFQGIGGAGMYNMTMVILAEAVAPEHFPKYVSLVAAITTIAFTLGPLVGGAITSHSTWRWVFWLNLPIGLLALLVDMISIPNSFPHHNRSKQHSTTTLSSFQQLDIIGALSFLGGSICLVAALQEASISFPWNSGVVTGLVSSLIGAPFTCATIQIPQRFQIVNGLSPFDAGIRLLAFIVMVPIGAVVGAAITDKCKVKPTYALLGGTTLQLVGAVCFAILPYSTEISASQYGYQILFGIGSGISNAVSTTSVPFIVQRKDVPAALGANTQFRYLGGAVGLGIISSILNSMLRPKLAIILNPEQLEAILQSTEILNTLQATQREQVLLAFADGFSLQWKVILAFIVAQIPAAFAMWLLDGYPWGLARPFPTPHYTPIDWDAFISFDDSPPPPPPNFRPEPATPKTPEPETQVAPQTHDSPVFIYSDSSSLIPLKMQNFKPDTRASPTLLPIYAPKMGTSDNRLTKIDILELAGVKSPTKVTERAVLYDSLVSTPKSDASSKKRAGSREGALDATAGTGNV